MECTVRWFEGMSFVAETGSGHLTAMDGSPEAGGRNLAPRPMELLLASAGGCTAFDVVMILKRGRHDVRGCQVKLSAERAEQDPKVFTRIQMHFVVSGRGVPAAAVEVKATVPPSEAPLASSNFSVKLRTPSFKTLTSFHSTKLLRL